MKARILALCLGLIGPGLLLITTGVSESQEQPPPPPDQPAAAGDTEAMARGPVHEAYAEPVNYQPQPGPVVTKQPPDPIEEQPPDQKPDGTNVQWIPGYWAWDEQSKDYLWVSGFWRDVPPGQRWVPGAWQEVEGGWQWSPGFWTSDQNDQVNYVPSPPPDIDAGPSVPPQNETDIYVPGCWVWRDTRFLWRPGFFVGFRPDWVWTPAHYVWTPGGCVFVEGFWDHPLERRGLLFSPVRFLRREFAGFVFTPSFVVQPDFLLTALFVGPHRHNFFFGDFFEDRFERVGFVPWFDFRPTRRSFDPLFNHFRVAFRDDPAWERNLRELFRARFSGEVPRPPHTIVEQQKIVRNLTVNKTTNVNVIKNINITNVQNVSVLAPLKEVHNVQVTNLASLAPKVKAPPPHVVKLQPVNREQIAQVKEHIQQVQHMAQTRREVESKLVAGGTVHTKPAEHPQGAQLSLPKPVAPVERPRGAPTPPPPPTAPKHEERPIPQHEPPKPPQPPRQGTKPPPQTPPPPPKKEEKPPPKKEEKPQQQPPPPPKHEPPPPPPKKEPPPPPPKHEPPPPPPPKHEPPPPPPKKEDKPPPPPPKKEPPPPPKKDDKPPPKKDGNLARAAHNG
jgi:hypothetical protein